MTTVRKQIRTRQKLRPRRYESDADSDVARTLEDEILAFYYMPESTNKSRKESPPLAEEAMDNQLDGE